MVPTIHPTRPAVSAVGVLLALLGATAGLAVKVGALARGRISFCKRTSWLRVPAYWRKEAAS